MTTATHEFTGSGRRPADRLDGPNGGRSDGRGKGQQSSKGPLADPARVARALGWFSIGLGLAEIAAPRRMARMIGIDDDDTNRNTLFAYGVREIASGVGILAQKHPVTPVWARVGGDMMDLAFLTRAYGSSSSQKNRVAAAAVAVLGVTVLDVLTGKNLSRARESEHEEGNGVAPKQGHGVEVRRQITINRPAEEVYRFWRDFENLPQFMEHLESVQSLGDRRSHWKARAPAGTTVEWDAEIIEDRPNERISWRSVDDAEVPNTGSVRFVPAPGDRGTEVHVELRYDPPGGTIAAAIAKLFGEEPGQQVRGDLRRLKQVMETGEVVHSDASIHRGMHPAQPSAEPTIEGAHR
ncbi:MAG: SRPBCC family protein [Gemmatimonadota bacterium]|nr:SRPBCC family protein [Gemmatimonadota bacterium]